MSEYQTAKNNYCGFYVSGTSLKLDDAFNQATEEANHCLTDIGATAGWAHSGFYVENRETGEFHTLIDIRPVFG